MKTVNKKMLARELGKIRDNKRFTRTTRKGATVYEVDRREKHFVVFTSTASERTFKELRTKMVYPV